MPNQICYMVRWRLFFLGLMLAQIQLFGQSHSIPIHSTCEAGDARTDLYFPLLKGKHVGVIANQTAVIGKTHLVDSLVRAGIDVVRIFAPEHGFRGEEGNGDAVKAGIDSKTGIEVFSLYGKQYKPSDASLKGIDVLVFDIQDVGTRFYTFLSTLHYVMLAAAEHHITLYVLDRPNPNGMIIDGPVLKDSTLHSFVGMHPIPLLHGCTLGELAFMINGEGWLGKGKSCQVRVIPCANYTHQSVCALSIPPSPNLRDMYAIYAYPSLCWYEGTRVSVGRGTSEPFHWVGYPGCPITEVSFVPKKIPGVSTEPLFENKMCSGKYIVDKSHAPEPFHQIDVELLLTLYKTCAEKEKFFSSPLFFDKLAGTKMLREQVIAGKTAEEIRASWAHDLFEYKEVRNKYLLYSDYE